jgi:hypothetical protein
MSGDRRNAILCVTVLAVAGFSSAVLAQSLGEPSIKPGDAWIYRVTTDKKPAGWNQARTEIAVTRVTSSGIYYTSKPAGSSQVPQELISPVDWSRARSIDGKETVVNRPLAFPLSAGKTWEVSYSEPHPNKLHKSEQWSSKFVAVGFEAVEVPAGKFNALKIEAEGKWTAEIEPQSLVTQGAQVSPNSTTMVTQSNKTAATTATGRYYKAFWYVPEVKRWVKSIEEYYNAQGVRAESYTNELESFKAGG